MAAPSHHEVEAFVGDEVVMITELHPIGAGRRRSTLEDERNGARAALARLMSVHAQPRVLDTSAVERFARVLREPIVDGEMPPRKA
ncbi:MAG: hypothetical protein ACFE0R_09315 [Salinarimonas sp.]